MSPIGLDLGELSLRITGNTTPLLRSLRTAESAAAESAAKATALAKKTAAEVSAATNAEATAAGRVRVAQLRLNEARGKAGASASTMARAEEQLAAAERIHARTTTEVAHSTQRLASAQEEAKLSSAQYAAAQKTAALETRRARPHIDGMTKAFGAFLAIELGRKMVQQAGDFQQATNVLVTAAGETQQNLAGIRSGIMNIATGTGAPIKELTDGMYVIEKAGIRGADGLKLLKTAAQGAREENADLGTVTNAMTSIMASYHVPIADNVSVMNQLKAAAGESKTTMEEFSKSLSTVLPIASANHISFAQVAGSLATLTQHGTTADEATQELANTIRNLAAPNMVATKMMGQLGINSQDLASKLGDRGVAGTLNYLSETVLRKMGPSGKVLLDTFLKSSSAAKDAKQMMDAMEPATRKLAQSFVDGSISQYEWSHALTGLTPQQASLARQFAVVENKARGFNAAIRAGQPGAVTYTAAIKAMTGGANGLNTTLQLTGESTAGTTERIRVIAEAAKNAGTDVQGWAITQKNFNTQMDIFKERVHVLGIQIGSALMPKLLDMTHGLSAILGFVQDNHKWLVPLAGSVLALGTSMIIASKGLAAFERIKAMGAAVQGFGGRIEAAGGKLQNFGGVATLAQQRTGTMVSGLGKAVSFLGGPWGIAIGLAATAIVGLALAHHNAVKDAQAFTDSLTFENGVLDENSRAATANKLAHEGTLAAVIQAGISEKDYTDALFAGGTARQQMAAQLKDIIEQHRTFSTGTDLVTGDLDDQGLAAQKAADAFGVMSTTIDKSATSNRQATNATGGATTATQEYVAATENAKPPVDKLATATTSLKDAQKSLRGEIDKIVNSFTILNNGALDAAQAEMSYDSSVAAVTASVKQNGKTLDAHTAAGIANRTSIADAVKAMNDKITADFKAKEKTDGLTAATKLASGELKTQKKRLEDQAAKAGLSKDAVKKLVDQWTVTKDELAKQIDTPGLEKIKKKADDAKAAVKAAKDEADKLKKKYGELPDYVTTKVNFDTQVDGINTILTYKGGKGARLIGMASGGVLPGWSPGRDVHHFTSPTGGNLDLSGGEAIMRPEWTRAVGGAPAVARMNQAAKTGQAFSAGGIFGELAMQGINAVETEGFQAVGKDLKAAAAASGSGMGSAAFERAAMASVGKAYAAGMCLGFVSHLPGSGIKPGIHDAFRAWQLTGPKHKSAPPAGVPVYWSGGSHGYGHIAASVGGGKIVSTDLPTSGRIGLVSLSDPSRRWGEHYLGWTGTAHGGGGSFTGSGGGGSARASGRHLMEQRWGASQWPYLDKLWNRESNWNVHALNHSSGAYGIPQALPGSKMASAGSDWRDNAATQERWGLGYIAGRYGSPRAAWAHEMAHNWYGDGTPYARSGLNGVAERGAELVVNPQIRNFKGGEVVFDAKETKRLLAQGGNGSGPLIGTLNLESKGNVHDDMAEVSFALRRLNRGGVHA